ncbi:hypothetical protein ACIREE_27305 [Streptomyces sp. NPDC102467]|uniref:hypothetical protein n=1 Tax=Streptomyces sp. NPDC102467 TaxID=3366179 RepID=UPI0037F3E540
MTFVIGAITRRRGKGPVVAAILVSNTLGTSAGGQLRARLRGRHPSLDSHRPGPADAGAGGPDVLLFWLAFVLTRLLGAPAGDLLTKPVTTGAALATADSSAVLFAVLIGVTVDVRRCEGPVSRAAG